MESSEEGIGAEESQERENNIDSDSDESTNSYSENTTIIQSKILTNIVKDLMFTKQRFCDAQNALGTIPT